MKNGTLFIYRELIKLSIFTKASNFSVIPKKKSAALSVFVYSAATQGSPTCSRTRFKGASRCCCSVRCHSCHVLILAQVCLWSGSPLHPAARAAVCGHTACDHSCGHKGETCPRDLDTFGRACRGWRWQSEGHSRTRHAGPRQRFAISGSARRCTAWPRPAACQQSG